MTKKEKGKTEKLIKTYTTEQSVEWDNLVRSFKNYDVYYLSGYVKAFEINGDGKAMLIYFTAKGDETRAINVVMKVDIADTRYFENRLSKQEWFDFVTPYGYGGWIIEGDDINSLQEEYEKWALNNHIVTEFVRFHPLLDNHNDKMYEDIYLGDTVYINTLSEDIIWSNFSSKNRNIIRKSQKAGVRVYWGRDPAMIDVFMKIYNATMDKDHAAPYYYFNRYFYESVLEDLKDHAMWFYSIIDNTIIAIAIFMFCNGKMHYHLSASRDEYKGVAPTNLLLYEAALWANNNGYKMLHLGGGVGAHDDSLYTFKKAFNRKDNAKFHIGKKIFNQEKYDELIKMKEVSPCQREICDAGYFPRYRSY